MPSPNYEDQSLSSPCVPDDINDNSLCFGPGKLGSIMLIALVSCTKS